MISEPKTQNDLQNDQESISFFTINHMAFRHVGNFIQPVGNRWFWRPLNVQIWVKNNIVYGVSNEIPQKVRIS